MHFSKKSKSINENIFYLLDNDTVEEKLLVLKNTKISWRFFEKKFLLYITFFTEILPLIFCILLFKKLNTKALKVFFIYTIVLAGFVVLGTIALYLFKSKPTYVFIVKLYYISEYSLFAFFLFYLIKNSIVKKIVIYSILPFTIISIITYFISPKSDFSNYPSLIEFLAFIVFIIYFFLWNPFL